MADNWWDKYVDPTTGPQLNESMGKYVPAFKKAGEKDVWDKYLSPTTAEEETRYIDPKANEVQRQMDKSPWANWLPGAQTMRNIVSPELTKGVLGARWGVPQTSTLHDFEKEHSYGSAALQATGTVGSMVGPAYQASRRAGQGFIPQAINQGAVNLPANLGDVAVKSMVAGRMPTDEELHRAMAEGSLESIFPAALNKFVGQGGRSVSNLSTTMAENRHRIEAQKELRKLYPDITRDEMQRQIESDLAYGRASSPPSIPYESGSAGISEDAKTNIARIFTTLGGMGIGHSIQPGMGTFEGALPGLVGGGDLIRWMTKPFTRAAERGLYRPGTQDIIRAMQQQTTTNLEPNPPNQSPP